MPKLSIDECIDITKERIGDCIHRLGVEKDIKKKNNARKKLNYFSSLKEHLEELKDLLS